MAYAMCGGCGETDPNKACVGCLHFASPPAPAARTGADAMKPAKGWNETIQSDEFKALSASPPAREEAPAEGAGEWTPTRGQVINAICNASPFGPDYKHPDLLRMSDAILAIRNRTSEPEAGAVAWRDRFVVSRDGREWSDWNYHDEFPPARPVEQQVEMLFTRPAPATADKLRPSEGTHWWNPENDEEGFSCWGDAFEDATFMGWDAPVRLERAKKLPDVWAVRIDIDTTGDGEADDYEIRLFDTEAQALAALNEQPQ